MLLDPSPLAELAYAIAAFSLLKRVIKEKRRYHVSPGVAPLIEACSHNPRLAKTVALYSWAGANILLAVAHHSPIVWVIRQIGRHMV